jgi:hypothetical protein
VSDPILDKLDRILASISTDVAPHDREVLRGRLRALLAEVAIDAIQTYEGAVFMHQTKAIYERFGVAPPSEET